MALDRPGEALAWSIGGGVEFADSVTPDGRRVVFERGEGDGRGRTSLWIKDLEVDGEATPLGSATASELAAEVSPDGQWLAYVSDATRSSEVYVRRLDGTGAALRISTDGGRQPLWRRDGRELFYLDASGRIVAVPIERTSGGELEPGRPEVLIFANLARWRSRWVISPRPVGLVSARGGASPRRSRPGRVGRPPWRRGPERYPGSRQARTRRGWRSRGTSPPRCLD